MNKVWKAISKAKTNQQNQNYDKFFSPHKDGQKLIEIKHLKVGFRHFFKQRIVLNDISFDIYDDEIIALLGSNGAGKTTLVNAIMGIIKHQDGTIVVNNDGRSIDELIGAQFQDLKFPQGLNVKDMINFELSMSTKAVDPIDLQLMLDTFKLTEFLKRSVAKLSGGQQQRLNVVLALITKPRIVFLDEFTTGLDIASKYEITEFIHKFCKLNKITAVLISHDTEAIERLAERFIIIANKEIVVDASKKTILEWNKSIDDFLKYYIR